MSHAEGGCGGPCQDAMDHLDEFVDGEVDASQAAAIAEHLQACPPCQRQYLMEELVKALVARSCVEQAPATLRARVVAHLVSARIRVV